MDTRDEDVSLSTGPLRVEDLGLSRGGHRILDQIDLTLHPGEMCALIGPSGAGKSSLIRVLLGLWTPDEGTVTIGRGPPDEAGPLGYVPQDDALHSGLSVLDELSYAAELRMPGSIGDERRARVDEVIAQVGLTERARTRIRKLSGGQRKRVALALELLTSPALLILDEPTSGLDPGLEAKTMALLADVARSGRIVLVATHAMESLERADSLCVLVGGRVAFFGPPSLALSYFRVERHADLFRQLEKQEPRAWHLTSSTDVEQRLFRMRPGPRNQSTDSETRGAEVAAVSSPRSPTRVLAARYRDSLLGDPGGMLVLLAQAPLIGWLCTVVWGSIESDTPALYFVLCLTAVWFGCINACREIVKERAILERERLFEMSTRDYVLSKVIVLAGLGAVQVLLLQGTVEWQLQLRGPMPLEMLALFGASLAGTGLGLVVSAVATTQERAVFSVPLLLLPQILFSQLAIPDTLYSDVVAAAEKVMPVHWAFRVFEESAAVEPNWFWAVLSLVILFAMGAALFAAAMLAVLPRREVVA